MTGIDHGELNVPLHKRYGRGGLDAEIDRQLAKQARERQTEHAERVAAVRAREANRRRLTKDDVAGAQYVRNGFGWWKVVRISRKTVTVETGYSWTERIALDKILEVHR